MERKRYTTKAQREILESVGVKHEQGRSYEDAQRLIEHYIQIGRLPRNAMSPPSEKQLAFLASHDVVPPSDITKEEASQLIDRKIEEIDRASPISQRQYEFIRDLGGIPSRYMSRFEASQFIDYLKDQRIGCANCGVPNDRNSDRCGNCGAFLPRQSRIPPPPDIYAPKSLLQVILGFCRL